MIFMCVLMSHSFQCLGCYVVLVYLYTCGWGKCREYFRPAYACFLVVMNDVP